jgi:hypothetical protein
VGRLARSRLFPVDHWASLCLWRVFRPANNVGPPRSGGPTNVRDMRLASGPRTCRR